MEDVYRFWCRGLARHDTASIGIDPFRVNKKCVFNCDEMKTPMRNFLNESVAIDPRASAVLTFWFCEHDDAATYGRVHKKWFAKSDAFDIEARTRFLSLYEDAAAEKLVAWQQHAATCLALIVLLDQFPRNMFRGNARAFAADHLARAATHHVLAQGFDRTMLPVERQFVYLPLEHSESLADQEQCLALMRSLAVFEETKGLAVWAEKHRVIIARFGRFPHRNLALGRTNTPDEAAFLQQPGSSF
jgi:uncharacterized protein (DUF924 family)